MLAALPHTHADPEVARFYGLLRDYPQRNGKVLRGQLVVHSARAHDGDEEGALIAAASIELFQNWVLVHDDIEDDSEERRGAPALHRSVGTPIALNVGDAMHVQMWRLLLTLPRYASVDREAILSEFAWMIERTAEGQHLDLSWVRSGRFDVSEEDYLAMVRLKTAYYTAVSPLRLGAACASVPPHAGFERAGADLGIAFQIRDDVLNLQRGHDLGKEFAGDLYEGKRTLILAHLFAHASAAERGEAEELLALPREAKQPRGVERVLAMIERHRSLEYAQAVADACADRGMDALRASLAGLPGAEASARLVDLLGSLARRTR